MGLRKGSLRTYATLTNLKLTGSGEINYVPAGNKNFNYWARRGPSGILGHTLPNKKRLQGEVLVFRIEGSRGYGCTGCLLHVRWI